MLCGTVRVYRNRVRRQRASLYGGGGRTDCGPVVTGKFTVAENLEGCETIKEKKILRVSEVQRDRYTLLGDTGEIYGKLKGSLYHNKQYPVVGDYVEVSCNPQGDSLIERMYVRLHQENTKAKRMRARYINEHSI